MIKLIVICVGVIIIVSTLIDKDPVNILTDWVLLQLF